MKDYSQFITAKRKPPQPQFSFKFLTHEMHVSEEMPRNLGFDSQNSFAFQFSASRNSSLKEDSNSNDENKFINAESIESPLFREKKSYESMSLASMASFCPIEEMPVEDESNIFEKEQTTGSEVQGTAS